MKILSTRNSSMLIMSSYLILKSEYSFTKYVSSYQIFLSTVAIFENEGVSDNTYDFGFQFWGGMVILSVEKSKNLMLVTRLKDIDLRWSSLADPRLRDPTS